MCSGLALLEMTHVSKPSQFIIQQKEKLQKDVDELLGTDGVFLYPSHPRVAPKHHHPLVRPFDFAYTGQSSTQSYSVNERRSRFKYYIQAERLLGCCWRSHKDVFFLKYL